MWRKTVALLELWAFLIVLVCLVLIDAHRFLSQSQASQFLTRHRRANSLFEESKKGNLERECIEELCNKEEAREIFENTPETEYFYPRYLLCLGSYRVGISTQGSRPTIPSDLRSCVTEISNQCLPFPCYKEGTEKCVDGKATFRCVCKLGWKGSHCNEDINECSDPDFPAGCAQQCYNFQGGFRCACEDGYIINDIINCIDVNECIMYPSICAKPAKCVNTPGMYECQCPPGFKYNFTSKTCNDVDECEMNVCDGTCQNTQGSYMCHCNGREGLRLAEDGRFCEQIPVCLPLYTHKHAELLYLGEQFAGLPMIYLRYRLSENTKFAAEFDFRTFDPEGVVLYAESTQDAWFMLGLRDGRIEVQFKNQHTFKVTSGGKAINDGQWHVISVDELDSSISVKISNEAVMSINSPESLFMSVNGKLETKVYIAGLPNRTNIIKPINPRLDGCIRGWNLMNQGASGVKEVIQEKKSKHCFVYVERGSYFTGAGQASFNIDYRGSVDWRVDVKMNIRPSSNMGVLFALGYNNKLPLSLSVVQGERDDDAHLQVFLDGVPVATLESLMLCYPGHLMVELTVTPTEILMTANSSTVYYMEAMQEVLARFNATMQNPVRTYIGGIPAEIPVSATPVTAYYHGCMDVTINGQQLDFDEALSKHNSIRSHSCPPIFEPEMHPVSDVPAPH